MTHNDCDATPASRQQSLECPTAQTRITIHGPTKNKKKCPEE